MGNENIAKFMKNSAIYITNLNRNLKNMKSEVLVDFICSNPVGITVITNKVSLPSDLLIIKNYVKNLESIYSSQVDSSWLPQSKSYFKIIGIPSFPMATYRIDSLPMMLNSLLSRIKSSTTLPSPLSQELLKSSPSQIWQLSGSTYETLKAAWKWRILLTGTSMSEDLLLL